jgi:hypothetical protein
MTKTPIENSIFAEKLKKLDRVLEVSTYRKEVEAKLYIENPNWGLIDEIEELLHNNSEFQEMWGIVDFSHIKELEDGGCHITVYFKQFNE